MGKEFRSGFVGISGKPNVGKSSLMNHYLRKKLSITTPKPQTTRNRITGIMTSEDTQIVFIDSPGLVKPRDPLTRSLAKTAKRIIREVDVILLVSTATEYASALDPVILECLEGVSVPVILAFNKIDTIRKPLLLPLIDDFRRKYNFADIVPISVLLNDGMDQLLETIVKYLPESLPFYDEDTLSELPLRFFVAEFVREKIFEQLKKEVPYSTAVKVEEFKKKTNKLYLKANIFVERESQKGIVIGKGGNTLKKIGLKARNNIEAFLEEPVYLELWVKVRPKWSSDPNSMEEFGYKT